MSSSIRQRLLELGFTITEDGKHYKVRYKMIIDIWQQYLKLLVIIEQVIILLV